VHQYPDTRGWLLGDMSRIMLFDIKGKRIGQDAPGASAGAAPASPMLKRRRFIEQTAATAAEEAVKKLMKVERSSSKGYGKGMPEDDGAWDEPAAWSEPQTWNVAKDEPAWQTSAESEWAAGQCGWSPAKGGGAAGADSFIEGNWPWKTSTGSSSSTHDKGGGAVWSFNSSGNKGYGKALPENKRRGGWFSRCQILSQLILQGDLGTARTLAAEYYAGPESF